MNVYVQPNEWSRKQKVIISYKNLGDYKIAEGSQENSWIFQANK